MPCYSKVKEKLVFGHIIVPKAVTTVEILLNNLHLGNCIRK